MRFYIILLVICLGNTCTSQKHNTLERLLINEFIKHNKQNITLFKNNKLYILGYGKTIVEEDIEVTFLSLAKVKEKVSKEGEFDMVRMNDIINTGQRLKMSFLYLTAKKNYKADFVYSDNFNNNYCIQYNCEEEAFNVFKCEN